MFNFASSVGVGSMAEQHGIQRISPPPVDAIGHSNRAIAWTGFCLGVISGSLMGLWAFNGPLDPPAWIGDYENTPRRFTRLGHISFFGIGYLNLLLARQLPGFDFERRVKALALRCMNAANILLPLLLFAAAAYAPLEYLLPIPVIATLAALVIAAWGGWREVKLAFKTRPTDSEASTALPNRRNGK